MMLEASGAANANRRASGTGVGREAAMSGDRERNLAAVRDCAFRSVKQEPMEFIHLARPAQSEQAFVRTRVLCQDKKSPRAQFFSVDGALVGKRPFSITGREAAVYFGADPLIKATSLLLAKSSGEKTLFADKQTYRWEWRLEITNGRNYPVGVRIEEPLPQSRDEKIQLSLKSDPEPQEKTESLMIWTLDVPAGGKKNIVSTVALDAPKNLPLDLGWRRCGRDRQRNLRQGLIAIEVFIDAYIGGNHVAEVVSLPGLLHDPLDLGLPHRPGFAVKTHTFFQGIPEAATIVIPEEKPVADILRRAVFLQPEFSDLVVVTAGVPVGRGGAEQVSHLIDLTARFIQGGAENVVGRPISQHG